MKNLSELIESYKNNPTLETQQAISRFYIKNKDNREQLQENLLDFFRSDNLKGGLEWYSFFESDKKFWNKVFLVIEEKNAHKYLNSVKEQQKKSNEVYLDFAVDMCDASASSVKEMKNMAQQVEKTWINVFKDFPQFSEMIEDNKKLKQQRLDNYLKSINFPAIKELVTIKTVEITVPIISPEGKSINFTQIENTLEYNEFMQDRIDFFNSFYLQGYMKHPQCHSVTMRIENQKNIFTLQLNDEVSLISLKKDLLGQLSDGLGSNLAQQPLLIDDKIYHFDFDVKNATEFYEVKPQPINKRKI